MKNSIYHNKSSHRLIITNNNVECKIKKKLKLEKIGRKNEFLVECPSIGEVKKLRIGHNNKGVAPGWYLTKVIVDDLVTHRVYEFACDRWLATDECDGLTTCVLHATSTSQRHQHDRRRSSSSLVHADTAIPYTLYIQTGDKMGAGTDANVFIEFFGPPARKARSPPGKRQRTPSPRRHHHNDEEEDLEDFFESSGRIALADGRFERGMCDKLRVYVPRMLMPVSRVLIGHDNSGSSPGWFLESVAIECAPAGMKQVFTCHKWLARDEQDGLCERMLAENTSLREVRAPANVWQVWVYTSDMRNAGTNAKVTMGKKI